MDGELNFFYPISPKVEALVSKKPGQLGQIWSKTHLPPLWEWWFRTFRAPCYGKFGVVKRTPPWHISGGKNGLISYRKSAQNSQVKVEIIFCKGNIFHFGTPFFVLKFGGFWFFDGDPPVEWPSRGQRTRPCSHQ